MGFARICRCGPGGTHGIDLVCEEIPADAAWHRPWAYARWRGVNAPPEPAPDQRRAGLPVEPGETGDNALRSDSEIGASASVVLSKR